MDRWTWALLVPETPEVLTPRVQTARVARYGEYDDGPPWEVREGRGEYTAVIDREPGSEGSDHDLAVELSRAIAGTTYLLRLREGAETAYEYASGKRVAELPDDPETLASRLGIDVPSLPPLPSSDVMLVVENASPDEVARALGLPGVPESGPLSIVADGTRTLVTSTAGNVAVLADDIEQATHARVHIRHNG